ncbi:MAG: tyrosine-protein phosphatase [Solirubrobacterales bacterium]
MSDGAALGGRDPTVEGLFNLRDVGGIPASGGRRIRSGVLYRSEAPVSISEEALVGLGKLRLRAVVDLRDPEEDGYMEATVPSGLVRLRAPVTPPVSLSGHGVLQQVAAGNLRSFTAEDLGAMYVAFLGSCAPAFGAAIGLCAREEHLPCLIHCAAGKDRTGLAVALMLVAIGACREAVLDDYELTARAPMPRHLAIEEILDGADVEEGALTALFSAPRPALSTALDHLEARYGSIPEYLRGPAGLTERELDRLSELLVED